MSKIWLLEPRGSDPIAFGRYEDAECEYIKDTRCGRTLDEVAAELKENDVYFEFLPGERLYIDDGPYLRQIEAR